MRMRDTSWIDFQSCSMRDTVLGGTAATRGGGAACGQGGQLGRFLLLRAVAAFNREDGHRIMLVGEPAVPPEELSTAPIPCGDTCSIICSSAGVVFGLELSTEVMHTGDNLHTCNSTVVDTALAAI
jgi:hypothetical protein